MALLTRVLLTLTLAVSFAAAQTPIITTSPSSSTAQPSSSTDQPSTTFCTTEICYQDNVYRDIIRSTAFCASFTAPPQTGTTATATPNPVIDSWGTSALTSACSCLYPSGATTLVTQAAIYQCSTVPIAPSPTAWLVDFEPGSTKTVNVSNKYRVENVSIVPPEGGRTFRGSSLRVNFTHEEPGTAYDHWIELAVTGLMRPYTDYTFIFWAREDPLVGMDTPFARIDTAVVGLKNGPAPPNGVLHDNPHLIYSGYQYHGQLDDEWQHFEVAFNSGEWPYFYIHLVFTNSGITGSGIIPSLWVDDIYLKEGVWDPGADS
ncbi:hypothetical protein F5B18DRAFT_651979 [Nemania serpens]|nr:hypothetical protein F5B18DRAFT_651979 [Nemania serpens]